MDSRKRYLFQGHAVAAAAHFRRFKDQPIQVDTCFKDVSAALPATGGCLTAESGRREVFHQQNLLFAFDSASALANGDYADQQAAFDQTLKTERDDIAVRVVCQADVVNLNLLNRLSIRTLQSQLVASDPRSGKQVQFTAPRAPVIDGVVLDNKPLLVHIDPQDAFLTLPTKQDVVRERETSPLFQKLCELRQFFAHDHYIVTTVVKELTFPQGKPDGVEIVGHNVLKVDNFGLLYFGELLIGDCTRRLTLLRAQLGSNTGGSACAGESKPNGETT